MQLTVVFTNKESKSKPHLISSSKFVSIAIELLKVNIIIHQTIIMVISFLSGLFYVAKCQRNRRSVSVHCWFYPHQARARSYLLEARLFWGYSYHARSVMRFTNKNTRVRSHTANMNVKATSLINGFMTHYSD